MNVINGTLMENSTLNKILLVEDEQDIRTIAQIALEEIGNFTVRYCESGKEALSCVENFGPDLILLDVMMPEMDGLTVLQELRKNKNLIKIPVVFMTAKVQTNEVTQYLSLGAADVITKPFDPIKLAKKLQEIWEKNHG